MARTTRRITDLVRDFLDGDGRALAQAISLAELQEPALTDLLSELTACDRGQTPSVGLTGAPGAGKSTLVDAMIHTARAAGRTVGVLAVDPSSPFTGGALLGDRVRMRAHALDPGVFVRSMGSRGYAGGLSLAAGEATWLLGAFGFDEVVVETVGAGQSEFDVCSVVDTTVVVLTPGMGDEMQLQKAGMMEIADVFVVNKADLPGASAVARQLRESLNMAPRSEWRQPIVSTVATTIGDASITQLWRAIEAHREHLQQTDNGRARTARRLMAATARLVGERARTQALARIEADPELARELERTRSPFLVAERLSRLHGIP